MAEFFMMYCTGGPEWRRGGEKKSDGQIFNSSEENMLLLERSTQCEMLFM
jgi:hypothetical protein